MHSNVTIKNVSWSHFSCEQLAQGCYAALFRLELYHRPIDRKINALPYNLTFEVRSIFVSRLLIGLSRILKH